MHPIEEILSRRILSYTEYISNSEDGVIRIKGVHGQYAIDSYKAATEADPNFADAYYRLCLVYLLRDELGGAIESYQVLSALEPDAERTKGLAKKIYSLHSRVQD